jgi:hypothetical protein
MLSLDSPEWALLQHAYGSAEDIPDLLRQLDTFPSSEGNAEPWFSLWSALAHQGDVYSASFAAVPHVIRVLSTAPERGEYSFFQFPARVEIYRYRNGITVPANLSFAYSESLNKLPALIGAAARREWDADFLACAMSALAVGKGFPEVAEAVSELDSKVSKDFLEWLNIR